MNPGLLRDRVELLRLVRTPDGQGGTGESWALAGVRWAEVRAVGTLPYRDGQQVREEVRYAIRLRSGPTTDVPLRFRWRGRTLEATGTVPSPAKGEIVVEAREIRP